MFYCSISVLLMPIVLALYSAEKSLESGNSRALQSFGKTFDLRGPGWGDQVPIMSGGIEVPVRNWPGRKASGSSTLWAEPE